MEAQIEEIPRAEKTIFDAITQGDLPEFKNILAQLRGSVDFFDENGMSALQHASYKGNKDMVQLLLDRGADVNSSKHDYDYTALHFAALSGNTDVCKLLLEAGAEPSTVNTVGRTAAQMAAFVGNHLIVSTINTYVMRSDVAYYSIPQEHQTEPHLPPFLVSPLHKFILCINIHPVRIALNIQNIPGILENAETICKVFELMCRREMIRSNETNEVMAFKYHYLSYVLKELHLIQDKQKPKAGNEEKKYDVVEVFSKKLLKPGKDGFSLDLMDTVLKDCVREFPFRECTTFHQMVSSLTNKDAPPALSVINCTINGQRAFAEVVGYCSTCAEEKPAKKCSKCKSVQYCDRECQRLHWFVHKKACNRESSCAAPSTPGKENIDTNELSSELQNLMAG